MLDPVTYARYQNEQVTSDQYYLGSNKTNLAYPGAWGYQYYNDGHINYNTGKYTGKPEDYAHPGWYYDEYGNSTQIDVADWQDEIFQTAFQHDYNLSVSGGDDKGYYSRILAMSVMHFVPISHAISTVGWKSVLTRVLPTVLPISPTH